MPKMFDNRTDISLPFYSLLACCPPRKVLKEISVGEIKPDETVDAVKEARLLAKVEHPMM